MADGVLEIRTYKLRSGARERFDALFRAEALPLLERHGIEVVGAGASLADGDHYVLVRGFPSLEARAEQSAAFYGSEAWLRELDARVMDCIETYHTVVLDRDAPPAAAAERASAFSRPRAGRAS